MSQSLSKVYAHIVFHTKNNVIKIRNEDKFRLFSYIGSVCNSNDSTPIKINGMSDHIHILCILSRKIPISKLIEEIKRHSSRWIKTIDYYYRDFAWQNGYAVFSVSSSVVEKTKQYILNQEEHHKKQTFKEEYISFLEEYNIEYSKKYLWT